MCATADLDALFGTSTVVVYDAGVRAARSHWHSAFDQWLAEFSSQNTRRAYERAWRDLLDFTGKQPWSIRADDVRDWILDLSRRAVQTPFVKSLQSNPAHQARLGYSTSTINQYLAAISSFYRFAMQRYQLPGPNGRDRPLHAGVNPAQAVRRPKSRPFRKAGYLDAEALTAILVAIPKHTIQGRRDLALFLGYMLTGRRNSEWRCLRWGDLEQRGSKVYHIWSGKGKEHERHELPPPVWDAIRNYLRAADRLETISDDHYVFAPLNDSAARLPNVAHRTWHRNRPLSLGHVNHLLKKYARRAGIDPGRVTVHTLRHSFAMLLDSLGVDVKTISRRLAHSNLNVTAIYLDHLKGVPDETWRDAAAILKLDLIDAPFGAKQGR